MPYSAYNEIERFEKGRVAMKITFLHPQLNTAVNKTRYKQPPASSTGGGVVKKVQFDRVELSPAAKEVQRAQNASIDPPDVQGEKVAEIKRQIEDGSYKIDSEKIAMAMIKDPFLHKP